MIKVLIVEDSPVVREMLIYILESDPEIRIIGTAGDGQQALELVKDKKPDIITMDIHMPGMDGFEATRDIMESNPVPIVIVSGSSTVLEAATAFRALEAGALTVIARPWGIGHPDHDKSAQEFIRTVKLMSEVKVVRRWPRYRNEPVESGKFPKQATNAPEIKLVAIGASTGGPVALERILSGLPKSFSAPIVVVQHISPGFVGGFVEWLSQASGFPVVVARDGDFTLPGCAYVAPDGCHMTVNAGGWIALNNDEPCHGLRPSVSVMFKSVVEAYGCNAVGVLLTGMGKDGAAELKMMKDRGAITIVQDKESSIVFGMGEEAHRLEADTYLLPPEKIASTLGRLTSKPAMRE